MPAALLYDSVDEANNRLAGTIVTYEGRPVMVDRVENHADGHMRVRIREFPYEGEAVRKRLDSPHFKRFVTPPLGFCNFFTRGSANTTWCERVAARSRRQGMCSEVFNGVELGSGARASWERLYMSDGFREMIADEYPTYDDVLGRLVPNSSIAVGREFALRMSEGGYTFLHWKRDEIGIVLRGNVMLRADRQHLIETIVENPRLPNRVEVL